MYGRRPPRAINWSSAERLCWQCLVDRNLGAWNNSTAARRRLLGTAAAAATKTKTKPKVRKEDYQLEIFGPEGIAGSNSKKAVLDLRDKYVIREKRSVARRQTVVGFQPLDEASLDERLNDILVKAEEKEDAETNLLDAFESYKPENLKVSKERMEQLKQELDKSFRNQNLRNYIRLMYDTLEEPVTTQGLRKAQFINIILGKIWKVEVVEEIDPAVDVVRKRVVESDRVKLFFIIGEGGNNIRALANSTNTKITVQLATKSLELTGTANRIKKCEAAIRNMVSNIVSEDVDVTPMLRVAGFDSSLIGPISRATSTFIDTVDEKTLRIYVSGRRARTRIDDAKRLLLNSFDLFGQFAKYSLLCETATKATQSAALFTVTENRSLPLRFRASHWSRWRSVREKPGSTTARSVAGALSRAKAFQKASDTPNSDQVAVLSTKDGQSSRELSATSAEVTISEEAVAGVEARAETPTAAIVPDEGESIGTSGVDTEQDTVTTTTTTANEDAAELAREDEEVTESAFQQLPAGAYASSSVSSEVATLSTESKTNDVEESILSDAAALKSFLDHERGSPQDLKKTYGGLPVDIEYHSYVGHIVHSTPASKTKQFMNLDALMEGNYSRLFINTVPHINDAMVRLKPYRIASSFLIHFSPSPWTQSATFENVPKVTLRVETDPVTGKLSHPSLTATLYETVADVLLPDKAADIRFVRRETVGLGGGKSPAVQKYLGDSQLNPKRNSKFVTPPSIRLELPSQMIGHPSESESETTDATTIEYFFTGLEHHSSFYYRWPNQDLVYSKIEGGAAGAKFQELRLKYSPNSEAPSEMPEVEGQAEREDKWWRTDEGKYSDLRPDLVKKKRSLGGGKAGPNPDRWNADEFHKAADDVDYEAGLEGDANGTTSDAESAVDAETATDAETTADTETAVDADTSIHSISAENGKETEEDQSVDSTSTLQSATPPSPSDSFAQFVTATRRILSLLEKTASRPIL